MDVNGQIPSFKGYARGCGVVKKHHNFVHVKKRCLIYLPRVADLGILRGDYVGPNYLA